ncbi:MAG: hypothetical protein IJL39_01410 [Clostridia bacterium]|nr:hypothetical protein [Clostridia bacterium]
MSAEKAKTGSRPFDGVGAGKNAGEIWAAAKAARKSKRGEINMQKTSEAGNPKAKNRFLQRFFYGNGSRKKKTACITCPVWGGLCE